MGAFLLIQKKPDEKVEEIENQYSESLDVFKKKELDLNLRIVEDDYVLYLFHKYAQKNQNFYRVNDNDFICATGTLIYNDKRDEEALKDMYNDLTEDFGFLKKVWGNYAC